MSSMSRCAVGSAVAATVLYASQTAGSSFLVAPGTASPKLRAPAGHHADTQAPAGLFGATGAASAVGAVAAAAGLVAVSRRRTSVAKNVLPEPRLVIDWRTDTTTVAVPGSEKACLSMVGSDVETGGEVWDPLGFSKLYDRNFDFNMVMTYPHVQWLREAEIKHGRVSMLAVVGALVQQFVTVPGYPEQHDWTKTLDTLYADKVGVLGLIQISVFAMIVEGKFYPGDSWIGQMDREPGDLGFDPFKLTKKDNFDLKKAQLQEIKNGRLAMIGAASIACNHYFPGSVPLLSGLYATRPEGRSSPAPAAFCGAQMPSIAPKKGESKTEARYTTQVVLPALTWIKTGVKASELKPKELKAKILGGNDVLVGKDESGKLFCVGNLCPHIGTPMSEGADVIGDVIVCPLHGSSFKVTTGELIDWCPSPPILGPLTGIFVDKKSLAIFEARTPLFGDEIEVLVDINAKKAYEADYWKGILDAQGKNDGTYY